MNKFMELVEIRKIIALVMTLLFAVIVLTGKDVSPEYLIVISSTIGYYFGKSTALDKPKAEPYEFE